MEFFYLLNASMFSRIFVLFRDHPLTIKKLIVLLLLQFVPYFAFRFNLSLIILVVIILSLNIASYLVEQKIKRLNLFRFLFFGLLFILYLIFSSSLFSLEFNLYALKFADSFAFASGLIQHSTFESLKMANVISAGVLFLLNEVNLLIRFLFEIFKVVPAEENNADAFDKKSYNAGRVIGMLERILIFIFVIINQFAAIGFIIAAKGFTRFKELDKREFAEYVLIGTLLSSLSAFVTALFIRSFL